MESSEHKTRIKEDSVIKRGHTITKLHDENNNGWAGLHL